MATKYFTFIFLEEFICLFVFLNLFCSLIQQQQYVLNLVDRLFFGVWRFDNITHGLIDLHWLSYPQRITYKLCMIMSKCLHDPCISCGVRTSLPGVCHQTDWGLRSFDGTS